MILFSTGSAACFDCENSSFVIRLWLCPAFTANSLTKVVYEYKKVVEVNAATAIQVIRNRIAYSTLAKEVDK